MDPADVLELAARQLAVRGTQAAGLMAGSMPAALGALSRTATTIARPASICGLALEAGAVAVHRVRAAHAHALPATATLGHAG
ncbi:MAG TPA: hypothetical protein VJ757_05915 [Pseudonocardiaceae bacterium]|nr:hypothetical protein [Pseudonocardiaceae bacterium]